MNAKRDLRIDFFRGLALLIVLVDHIEGWAERSVVEQWTLISLGFSDAAEIFIFLSGYVLAVAYSSTLDRNGLAGCVKKALRRSLQIYVAYVLAAMSVLIGGALCLAWEPPLYNDFFRVGEHFASSVLAIFTLRFHPWGFDILALYVVLLPAMAVMFYLLRRAPEIAWFLSIGGYLAAQWNPGWALGRFGDAEPWYFNPLAWQLLFFVGLYLGDPQRKPMTLRPRWLMVTLSILMLLVAFFVLKVTSLAGRAGLITREDVLPIYQFYWNWGGKTTLQPLRLLHFFALAYLTSLIAPRDLVFWSTRLAKPIVTAGQHSLEVYAWGLVMSFWAAFAIERGWDSAAEVVFIDLLACATSLLFAYVVRWWKRPVFAIAGERESKPTMLKKAQVGPGKEQKLPRPRSKAATRG